MFVARRVEALRRRGVEVDVVAPHSYRASGLRRHLAMLRDAIGSRPRPDGVEGHVLLYAGLIAVAAAIRHRRPLVIYAHGLDVRETAQRTFAHRALARLVARFAAVVVTNSRATASLVDRLGVRAEVVPPGVDMSEFKPGDRVAARARLGLPASGRLALYVGTLSRRKGADIFAEALDATADWTGTMVGAGELAEFVRARHPALRLVGVVAPSGIRDWFNAANVVVVPSREEPLGLAAVEALACGIPVIASRTGGLVEVVLDGVNGILVEPGDSAAVTAALDRLGDAGLRDGLGRAARPSVAEHDLARTTEAMASLWARLGVTA